MANTSKKVVSSLLKKRKITDYYISASMKKTKADGVSSDSYIAIDIDGTTSAEVATEADNHSSRPSGSTGQSRDNKDNEWLLSDHKPDGISASRISRKSKFVYIPPSISRKRDGSLESSFLTDNMESRLSSSEKEGLDCINRSENISCRSSSPVFVNRQDRQAGGRKAALKKQVFGNQVADETFKVSVADTNTSEGEDPDKGDIRSSNPSLPSSKIPNQEELEVGCESQPRDVLVRHIISEGHRGCSGSNVETGLLPLDLETTNEICKDPASLREPSVLTCQQIDGPIHSSIEDAILSNGDGDRERGRTSEISEKNGKHRFPMEQVEKDWTRKPVAVTSNLQQELVLLDSEDDDSEFYNRVSDKKDQEGVKQTQEAEMKCTSKNSIFSGRITVDGPVTISRHPDLCEGESNQSSDLPCARDVDSTFLDFDVTGDAGCPISPVSREKHRMSLPTLFDDSSELVPVISSQDHQVLMKAGGEEDQHSAKNRDRFILPSDPTSFCTSFGGEVRWEIIQQVLRRSSWGVDYLVDSIETLGSLDGESISVKKLGIFFERKFSPERRRQFFSKDLPAIARLALRMPDLFPENPWLLKKGDKCSVSMTQEQAACLLSHMLFCSFPVRDMASFPSRIDFRSIYANLQDRVMSEKLRCLVNYLGYVAGGYSPDKRPNGLNDPNGVITITRQVASAPDWKNLDKEVCIPFEVRTEGAIEEDHGLVQADFANRFIGGGVLGHGAVQEEIRFLVYPELIVSLLLCESMENNEAIFITGAQQYSKYSGYARTFSYAGCYRDYTQTDQYKRRLTCVVAFDATYFSKNATQWLKPPIERELLKASAAFSSGRMDNLAAVATGNWGCGAFNGDSRLKVVIQLLAASAAGRAVRYYTFGDYKLKTDIEHILDVLEDSKVTISGLYQILMKFSESSLPKTGTRFFTFIENTLASNYSSDVSDADSNDFFSKIDMDEEEAKARRKSPDHTDTSCSSTLPGGSIHAIPEIVTPIDEPNRLPSVSNEVISLSSDSEPELELSTGCSKNMEGFERLKAGFVIPEAGCSSMKEDHSCRGQQSVSSLSTDTAFEKTGDRAQNFTDERLQDTNTPSKPSFADIVKGNSKTPKTSRPRTLAPNAAYAPDK